MNTGAKLAAFAAVVAVSVGGALVIGNAVGPIDVGAGSSHGAHGTSPTMVADTPRGLAIAQDGFRFAPDAGPLGIGTWAADAPSVFAFHIVNDHGTAITGFDELHERPLHLIVLSRNLIDYLHLHPVMDPDGRWTVDLPALTPGSYRVFADFQPNGGSNITLGADLTVPGEVAATTVPEPTTVASVDGYTVTMTGSPAVGEHELTFTVALDGATIRTDPYLGAAGHLVAIRAGDLAYLHVHPDSVGSGPAVTFMGEFPTPGTYRLFFDFSHDGAVHTATFTAQVEH